MSETIKLRLAERLAAHSKNQIKALLRELKQSDQVFIVGKTPLAQ